MSSLHEAVDGECPQRDNRNVQDDTRVARDGSVHP